MEENREARTGAVRIYKSKSREEGMLPRPEEKQIRETVSESNIVKMTNPREDRTESDDVRTAKCFGTPAIVDCQQHGP